MKTLLVVRGGWRLPQRFFAYRTFAARGWRVAVIDRVMNQSLRVADVPVSCDFAAVPEAVRAIGERVGRPDGVLTFTDSGLVPAARLAEAFGLPFLPVEVAMRAVDKIEQRSAFSAAGLPLPEWRPLAGPEDAAATAGRWGRTIVKPADRAAGVGVRLVETAPEAEQAYRRAAAESRRGGRVLAERYLAGPEVSVESIAVEGRQRAICVTDKVTTDGPHFVEVAHAVPSALPPSGREAVVRAALAACDALGLCWGACHTEVKVTDAGPVVVEVNPRPAGDCIADLVHLALGVNLYELLGRQALGDEVGLRDLLPRREGAAAIHFLLGAPGVFRAAHSALESRPPPWLVELSVTAAPGERLGEPSSNGDRIGYAIATGPSSRDAAERARSAIESLEVQLTPEPATLLGVGECGRP